MPPSLRQPMEFYGHLAVEYGARREQLMGLLTKSGFQCFRPAGAYYVMTDISNFGYPDDLSFVRHLINQVGLAAVPGSSFYSRPELGKHFVRFCFCKKPETLEAAGKRLEEGRL